MSINVKFKIKQQSYVVSQKNLNSKIHFLSIFKDYRKLSFSHMLCKYNFFFKKAVILHI